MSDENKDPDLQEWIDPELEARVVAWVVGEASEFEASELERIIREKPELGIFKRRIEAVHGLVQTASRNETSPMRMEEERRQKLLETMGQKETAAGQKVVAMPGKEGRKVRPLWWRVTMAAAACLLVGAVLAGLTLYSTGYAVKKTPHLGDAEFELEPAQQAVNKLAEQSSASPGAAVNLGEIDNLQKSGSAPTTVANGAITVTGATNASVGTLAYNGTPAPRLDALEALKAQAQNQSDKDEIAAADEPDTATRKIMGSENGAGNGGGDLLSNRSVTVQSGKQDQITVSSGHETAPGRTRYRFEGFINYGAPISSINPQAPGVTGTVSNEPSSIVLTPNVINQPIFSTAAAASAAQPAAPVAAPAAADMPPPAGAAFAAATLNAPGAPPYPEAAAKSKTASTEAADGEMADNSIPELPTKPVAIPATGSGGTLALNGGGAAAQASPSAGNISHLPVLGAVPGIGYAFSASPSPAADNPASPTTTDTVPILGNIQVMGRAFKSMPPPAMDETKASDQPYSTFSLHVSDVSFLLARAALAQGQLPDPPSVRPEEFYNAFDYGDPAPAPGEQIACHIEQAAHPILMQRNLVRIAVKVASSGRGAGQPLRLTILLDTSGSMEREDRAASVRKAMEVLASLLGPDDSVTLIGFARQPRLLAEAVPGNEAGKLVDIVKRTPAEGGTNMEEAIKTAGELALRHFAKDGQNRIVMLTDGAANLGDADPGQLSKLVDQLRQKGVSFDACGVGASGLDDEMLEALTRKGGGRYYFLNQPEDADSGFAQELAGAFRPAAMNVKMQVRFNPDRVGNYRLIGFEKNRLKQEDFRNNNVTAAQLAGEEAAIALYQVQVLPEGEGEIGEVFVRFQDPANGKVTEQSWTIPYDEHAPVLDKATPSMQLAAVSSLLAEKLHGGGIAGELDLDTLEPIVTRIRGHYAAEPRVQDLVNMFEETRRLTGETNQGITK